VVRYLLSVQVFFGSFTNSFMGTVALYGQPWLMAAGIKVHTKGEEGIVPTALVEKRGGGLDMTGVRTKVIEVK
jgi:hypothetical protein